MPAVAAVLALITLSARPIPAVAQEDSQALNDLFERRVRPVLVNRCAGCHGSRRQEGGLRLDSRAALLRGGDSGPALQPGKPDESLMIQAVRHQSGLEMPPDGRLTASEIDGLAEWIRGGAIWPGTAVLAEVPAASESTVVQPVAPDSGQLADTLQLWLRADSLQLEDNASVAVWPDQSRHGRDVSATRGVRSGGIGQPGMWVRSSSLLGRPAVRFSPATGLASSPGNPVAIHGDAPLTILLVLNLQQFSDQPSHATVFSVGNPAHAGDPGRPLAALVEIDQPNSFSLDFAGGWGHDATAGAGSFQPFFNRPILIAITKAPGPMRQTTEIRVNGEPLRPANTAMLAGSDLVPDIQHRSDLGVFLGRALDFCGSIQGDVGEVLLYNTCLQEPQLRGVEAWLGEKYGLWIRASENLAPPAQYTAAERAHWAWQPITTPPLPAVSREAWVRTPVDHFVLSALDAAGREPAAAADRLAWLRRVTFDLTGLPPTPEEAKAFLADSSAGAEATVVERLLASPHYGERWARHWLDVVRYAESTANDANAVMSQAWRYRNYVIDALNADLPYDQFLTEQLAGDLLPRDADPQITARRIIASGYLMIGPKALAETDKEQSRLDIVDDQIDVTGRAMLGLTLACARCHDHKFDPIRTTDYYALAGIFRSTEPFQNEVRNATMWWEYSIDAGGDAPITVMAPKEAQPKNLRVHLRGNRFTPGKIVPRGVPGILAAAGSANSTATDTAPIIDPQQPSSGRLELARWIASPTNPLTARVLVNRVWQLHFGRGIVATSDNFGTRGERPEHPQLLDWLASRLIADGWSLKQLHRVIVLSSAYRMQQGGDSALQYRRRRLSAEELRDAMLAVSGQLDRQLGGSDSGDFLFSRAEDINATIRPNRVAADDPFYDTFRRRSIYLPVVRNMLPDVLALFDAADPNGVTAVRNQTTVASQGLFLLNHPLVRSAAAAFAKRVLEMPGLSDRQRIDLAHRLAFGRPAAETEQLETQEFLAAFAGGEQVTAEQQQAAWQAFCQSLLCAHEFLYLE